MSFEESISILVIVVVTIISGYSDAQGVLHAAKVWHDGKLVAGELARSALGFAIGISMYWVAVRYMEKVGIFAPEIQTVIWFGVMIIGVALASRAFFDWNVVDQLVALGVFAGVVWLSIRAG